MAKRESPSPRECLELACRALFAPDQIVELRILGLHNRDGFNAAGWFNDHRALIDAALAYDGKDPYGVYATLNPVHEACLARGQNHVREGVKKSTPDQDIVCRHWLPVDVDPVRPADVSSTDAELRAAQARAKDIAQWLEDVVGWPPGLRAHSGNGFHLLYRVQLPNDETANTVVRDCLQVIKERYSDKTVKVDNLFNPARIWRLYGTVARKGEPVAVQGRLHRRSCLWQTRGRFLAFDEVPVTAPELLEQVASFAPAKTRASGGGGRRASKKQPAGDAEAYFDLETWLRDNNVPVAKVEPWDGGTRYVLEHCLFDPSHTRTSACIGRTKDGRIFYRCHHDSCTQRTWRDARGLYERAGRERRKVERQSLDDVPANPWELARDMIDDAFTDPDTGHVLARRHREQFYVYSEKARAYRPWSHDTLRVAVTRWLGDRLDKVTRTRVADVVDCLCAYVTLPAELDMPFLSKVDLDSQATRGDADSHNWVTLTNGVLDIDAVAAGRPAGECLRPHDPDWFSTTALPFPFPTTTEQAECPTWTDFLDQIFQSDAERGALLQEAFGYCFSPAADLEAFFVLHGSGRNGKSTCLDVLVALLGEANVLSLSPEQIANRYMVGALYGRLANVCADLSELDRIEEGLIKAIVSGDLITADRKYRSSFQFRARAKLFFATNVLPRFADTSIGVWRRMRLIPFDYIVPADCVDVHLFNKLESELPGILLWALEGLARLSERRGFTRSERCERATREYKAQCFPVLMFLEECCLLEPTGRVIAGDLWRAYRGWCEDCGLKKPKPLHTFVQDVLRLCPGLQYQRLKHGLVKHVELFGIRVRGGLEYDRAAPSYPETSEPFWEA